MKNFLVLFFSLLIGVQTLASEGIKMIIITKEAKTGKVEEATVYLNEKLLSVESEDFRVIYNSSDESLTTINNKKKEYTLITKAELQAFTSQMKQMVNLMKGQLQNLPPEQREMIERLTGENQNKTEYAFKQLNNEQVNGWNTKKYSATEDGAEIGQFNLASFSTLNTSEKYFAPMKSFIRFFHDSFSNVLSGFQMNNAMGFVNFTDANSPIFNDGVPVKMIYKKKNELTAESEVKNIENIDGNTRVFEVPAGYTKRSLEDMMQGSLMGR